MVKAGTYVNNQNKSTQTVYDNADNNNHTQKRKKKRHNIAGEDAYVYTLKD